MSYSEIITIAEDSVIDLACSLQIQCLFHHGGDSKLIPKSDKNKKMLVSLCSDLVEANKTGQREILSTTFSII